jgi:hypothetical protein
LSAQDQQHGAGWEERRTQDGDPEEQPQHQKSSTPRLGTISATPVPGQLA